MRKVRKLRHWKQRFDKNAAFIWRKPVFWMGDQVEVADPIPEALANTPNKLRRFWEAGIIELAEFEEPNVVSGTVEPSLPPEQTLIGHDEWPSEVEVNGESVPLGDLVTRAFEASEMTVEEWNASEDAVRADLLQVTLGEMTGGGQSDSTEEQGPVEVDPESLVTKETDRKWHVEGLEEVFKSKIKALEAAQAMIAERQATEKTDEAGTDETAQPDANQTGSEDETEEDDWLEGGEKQEE